MEKEIVFQLILATFLGALLGLEREWKRKSAGLQTYSLIALGSCLFTVITFQFPQVFLGKDIAFDPSRIIQAVATGIGFIGTGVIFFQKNKVEGITTAAGLWATAAIGVAVGVGFYFLAILSTVLGFIILFGFWFLEKKFLDKEPKSEEK